MKLLATHMTPCHVSGMSTAPKQPKSRLSVPQIRGLKGTRPVVALTAYTAPMARLLDEQVDVLLVGDSLGMVLYGLPSTLQVTLEDMIRHGRAVVNASAHALSVVDMPFGSYQASPQVAFDAAARIMRETACSAVKLEGGEEMAETIAFLTARGIPVMAHIGLKPQHVHSTGGYRYQGRSEEERTAIRRDALAIEKAGAFSVVMECVEQELAMEISRELAIPTIGIGSGPGCDGQVVVTEDMLGLFERTPKFIAPLADLRGVIQSAAQTYAHEVRNGVYPAATHAFSRKRDD